MGVCAHCDITKEHVFLPNAVRNQKQLLQTEMGQKAMTNAQITHNDKCNGKYGEKKTCLMVAANWVAGGNEEGVRGGVKCYSEKKKIKLSFALKCVSSAKKEINNKEISVSLLCLRNQH